MSILQQRALGLLETQGLIAAIDACDALCKVANVTLLHVQRVGAARVCVLFAGELGACEAALEAGARAALLQGGLTGRRIIARPLEDMDRLLEDFCPGGVVEGGGPCCVAAQGPQPRTEAVPPRKGVKRRKKNGAGHE